MKIVLFSALAIFASCSKKDSQDNDAAKKPYTVIQGEKGLQFHTGLLPSDPATKNLGTSHVVFSDCGNLPDSFDLRTLGVVPEIKNQGQCGSCWSFSKTASLESALLGKGKTLNLSEQEMVSCDTEQFGCGGGFLSDFKYQINKGQALETDFPYVAADVACKGGLKPAAQGASFKYVGTANRGPTDQELKCALFKYKTVPWITVGATNAWGSPPASEKTPYANCTASQTNHAVGVVGWYTDARGGTQFIMKNSWGKNWGDQGYMALPLGCNNFGAEVAFIELAKDPTPPGPTPPPGPCAPPKVKLPAEVQVLGETEVMLGVKAEAGVTYSWSVEGKVLGSESMLYVVPSKDAIYKISAKNACATVESQVRVRLVFTKPVE